MQFECDICWLYRVTNVLLYRRDDSASTANVNVSMKKTMQFYISVSASCHYILPQKSIQQV